MPYPRRCDCATLCGAVQRAGSERCSRAVSSCSLLHLAMPDCCLELSTLPCCHHASMLLCCHHASMLPCCHHASMLPCFHAAMLPCCHAAMPPSCCHAAMLPCPMPLAPCSMLHVLCSMLHAPCPMLHTPYRHLHCHQHAADMRTHHTKRHEHRARASQHAHAECQALQPMQLLQYVPMQLLQHAPMQLLTVRVSTPAAGALSSSSGMLCAQLTVCADAPHSSSPAALASRQCWEQRQRVCAAWRHVAKPICVARRQHGDTCPVRCAHDDVRRSHPRHCSCQPGLSVRLTSPSPEAPHCQSSELCWLSLVQLGRRV
jgi:hypothetical protein